MKHLTLFIVSQFDLITNEDNKTCPAAELGLSQHTHTPKHTSDLIINQTDRLDITEHLPVYRHAAQRTYCCFIVIVITSCICALG